MLNAARSTQNLRLSTLYDIRICYRACSHGATTTVLIAAKRARWKSVQNSVYSKRVVSILSSARAWSMDATKPACDYHKLELKLFALISVGLNLFALLPIFECTVQATVSGRRPRTDATMMTIDLSSTHTTSTQFVGKQMTHKPNTSARTNPQSSLQENAKCVTTALRRLMGIPRKRATVEKLMTMMIITTWKKQRKKSFALIANKVGGCVGGLGAVVFVRAC